MPVSKRFIYTMALMSSALNVVASNVDVLSVVPLTTRRAPRGRTLRGASGHLNSNQNRRKAKGKKGGKGGHHHSSYLGCLELSNDELEQNWKFSGNAPNCSYVHEDDTDGSGGENSYAEDDEAENGGGGDGGGGDDGGDGSDNGGNESGADYGVVVSNEDVLNGTDYDPYDDFMIGKCETYSYLWLWDLSLSCENVNTFEACNCTFAEELLDLGLLECSDHKSCPEDCPICSTCLSMLGCINDSPPGTLPGVTHIRTSIILWIIGGAVAFLILVLTVFYSRRRAQEENDLKENLIIGSAPGSGLESKTPSSEAAPRGYEAAHCEVAKSAVIRGDDNNSFAGTVPTVDETTVNHHEEETVASGQDDDTEPTSPKGFPEEESVMVGGILPVVGSESQDSERMTDEQSESEDSDEQSTSQDNEGMMEEQVKDPDPTSSLDDSIEETNSPNTSIDSVGDSETNVPQCESTNVVRTADI